MPCVGVNTAELWSSNPILPAGKWLNHLVQPTNFPRCTSKFQTLYKKKIPADIRTNTLGLPLRIQFLYITKALSTK